MKVSVSWLKDLVEFNNDIDELAEKLSMTGFEVESIEDLSAQAKNVVMVMMTKSHHIQMPKSSKFVR